MRLMIDRSVPAPEAKRCPLCGGGASWGFIRLHGTGASGMERPDITLGCVADGLWLPKQKTETWEPGKGTYSIEADARAHLLAIWDRRDG